MPKAVPEQCLERRCSRNFCGVDGCLASQSTQPFGCLLRLGVMASSLWGGGGELSVGILQFCVCGSIIFANDHLPILADLGHHCLTKTCRAV